MALQSHPHLRLSEHIAQIGIAMTGIFQWHPDSPSIQHLRALSAWAAKTHDLGKGTSAFQEFIHSPTDFRGNRDLKRHTALSQLLVLRSAMKNGIAPTDRLILAAVSRGHHSEFPSLEDLRDAFGGETARILRDQCKMVDLADLELETGVEFEADILADRPWSKAKRFLDDHLIPALKALALEDAVYTRLVAQFVFSLLLEADKAFLAAPDEQLHVNRRRHDFDPNWVEKRLAEAVPTPINDLRLSARKEVLHTWSDAQDVRMWSLTAPTGIGKTLLGATWAFHQRQKQTAETGTPPKIIIVLPFLTIIDQTVAEYRRLLGYGPGSTDGSWLLTSHSLSDRHYDDNLEEAAETFFIDTWRTELIITTYDQFLYALFHSSARHQMRFHNLCDALIVIDELQTLPCHLWDPFRQAAEALANRFNTRFLFMSATMPAFLPEVTPLLPHYQSFFKSFNRYNLRLRLQETLTLSDLNKELESRLPVWVSQGQKVMLTFNTRASARFVRDWAAAFLEVHQPEFPLFFITADVAPIDRRTAVDGVREAQSCLVVSTQCVEAGVDLDLDLIIRDFAPLDNLVQIAGRCNRNGRRTSGEVEIVDLVSNNGRRFSEMIYHHIQLQETRRLLVDRQCIAEQSILPLADDYFQALGKSRDLGKKWTHCFAFWEEPVPIRRLLRGLEGEQIALIVSKLDPGLKQAILDLKGIEDRWQRREAWRRLAGRIARVSINVFLRKGFEPSEIAEQAMGQWFLREDYYESSRGLVLPQETPDEGVVIF